VPTRLINIKYIIICAEKVASPVTALHRHPIAALLLIYRPRRDERLSWPGWLTYSMEDEDDYDNGRQISTRSK